jgi:hypothetical protein
MRAWWVFLVGCQSAAAPSVDLVTVPMPTATVTSAKIAQVAVPGSAAVIDAKTSGIWARAFRPAKTFRIEDLGDAEVALLVWRVGPQHAVKDLPADQDYGANHVQPVELLVHARDKTTTVTFGELSGSTVPRDTSYCKHRGFRLEPTESRWGFAPEPEIASAFSVTMAQGSDDFLVVRDAATLEVLHRESDDGKCDEAKQGPLDICEGSEWQRAAEIHLAPKATLYETIDDAGRAFDCTTKYYSSHLLPRE